MWINTPHARVAVGEHRGLRLNAGRGTWLRAVRGTLWVTIDNDPRDIVLDPGQSYVVDTDQPLFVMALGDDAATLDVCGADTPAVAHNAPPSRRGLAGLWPRRPQGAVARFGLRPLSAG